ncbi:hypothetical protein PISL3812_03126 [Talaromyces islandicus]|uniref:F-box domain-containing protein n=1 Tax=Talaromyces islandicus TaxID=28573 RepID=A0A0U1LRV3_TALIS|nr:hypothetical protein PISL3812_03126 [Talaromyces islandicus]
MVMGKTTASLYSLPYDLLYQIVTDLDCIDYIHLSRTNRTLYSLLQNELLAKRSIENSVREAKEARQAYAGKISFREAIGRIYDVKQAVAYANPYSVAVLAYASTFLYQDGVLSYYCANEIRVLDIHQAARKEQVLDVRNVFRRIIPAFREDEAHGASIELSFLYYAAGVLAILAEIGHTSPWLILLDVSPRGPASCNRGRLRFLRQLRCTRRLFVRHNHSHLFYGVYSTVGLSSDPQWSVQWVDLTQNTDELGTGPILLDKFAGTDIGQNVCFEIFDNHLYAVTSALDSNEEQFHPESFYEWTCISPASRIRRAPIQRIFRRMHTEGPINDTWSDISLRLDEATGRPMITECRREWLQNRTDNVRTYYTEPLMRPSEMPSTGTAEDRLTREAEQPTPRVVTPLISAASSHYPLITGGAGPSNMTIEPSPAVPRKTPDGEVIRSTKYKHTEYPDSTMPKRDFILARTKYRAYNPSAAAFVDLINDPEPSTSVGVVQDRLRLRICSRKRKQPIEEEEEEDASSRAKKKKQSETSESEEEQQQYISNGVKLWPADDADQDLLDLLCPAKRAANVHGASDERTLVYSVDIDTDEPHQQAIILVGFDPRIRLPCMRSRKRKLDESPLVGTKHNRRVGIVLPRLRDIKDSSKVLVEDSQKIPRPRSVRTEDAMHLSINSGYWFDRG